MKLVEEIRELTKQSYKINGEKEIIKIIESVKEEAKQGKKCLEYFPTTTNLIIDDILDYFKNEGFKIKWLTNNGYRSVMNIDIKINPYFRISWDEEEVKYQILDYNKD